MGWRILLTYPVIFWKSLKVKPDIIHFFVPELIPFALVCQWLGATVIYEVQENLYQKLANKSRNNSWLFRKAFYFFDRLARQKFNFIFTEDAYRNEYNNLLNKSIVLHNYSFKALDINLKDRATIPSFIYSGVITKERGLDIIIKACNILEQSFTEFQIHLFGINRLGKNEMKKIEGFETAASRMVFHGYTDYKQILENGKACLAGLAVLKNTGDYQYSYPSKIFDYMAIGIPVITSDFPLYKQIVEENQCGFCIAPDNPVKLAEKMRFFIENPIKADQMGARGYQKVQSSLNWENEANLLRNFYAELLT